MPTARARFRSWSAAGASRADADRYGPCPSAIGITDTNGGGVRPRPDELRRQQPVEPPVRTTRERIDTGRLDRSRRPVSGRTYPTGNGPLLCDCDQRARPATEADPETQIDRACLAINGGRQDHDTGRPHRMNLRTRRRRRRHQDPSQNSRPGESRSARAQHRAGRDQQGNAAPTSVPPSVAKRQHVGGSSLPTGPRPQPRMPAAPTVQEK